MDTREIRKTAILIDGGYYRKRANDLWGKKPASERADELFNYCLEHIAKPNEPRDLYRIFYYDCKPMESEIVHPLTANRISFKNTDSYKWSNEFYRCLTKKRKFALRMGELAESQAKFVIRDNVFTEVLNGKRNLSSLTDKDFYLDVKQKGVDMKIGLDIASLAYGEYVNQVVLIAGDSDFVPVAKMARRHGIDFLLDPLKQKPKQNLLEHIDGIETFV